MIRFLSFIGATSALKRFPPNEITMGRITMMQKEVDRMRKEVIWPVEPEHLPEISIQEVKKRCKLGGESLVIIDKLVHDITPFISSHPGGEALLRAASGRDATRAFHGGVYKHSRAAANLLAQMRVGRLRVSDGRHEAA
jgi:stearoyl-CoA desaturase (delta-9 desaturase)